MHYPWLFQPGLADVSDIANDLARKHGDWYPFLKEHALRQGTVARRSVLFTSFPGSHRIDLFEKVGEREPDTWEDLLRAGRKLKKLGHPVGFAISQTTDSVTTLYSILWCYGAKDVAEDGKTVTINSKETEAAIEYVRALYTDAMDPPCSRGTTPANNQCLNSGKGSWIHNPISHYVVAKQKKMPVAELTGFHPSPAGPAGRHTVGVPRSLGIWKFSKNVDVAREFLRWFFEPAQYHEWVMSGDNYNHPVWRDMENHPVWDIDPKYKPLKRRHPVLAPVRLAGPGGRAHPARHEQLHHSQHGRQGRDQRLQAQGSHASGRDGDQADVRQEVARGDYAPSTITRLALDALRRMASSGAYSGESYQRRALSMFGNSSSTMRFGCQVPSRVSNFPPRTAKRPPYFSTVAGTSLRYSARPGSS